LKAVTSRYYFISIEIIFIPLTPDATSGCKITIKQNISEKYYFTTPKTKLPKKRPACIQSCHSVGSAPLLLGPIRSKIAAFP
jgi:hypothetical protein